MQTVRSYASLGWTSLEGQNGWHHASRILLHFQLQLPMDFWQVSLASGSPNVGLVMHLLPSRMVHPKLGFLTWDSQYSRNWMEGLGLVILTVLPPVRCTRHRRVRLLSKYWYANYWWCYSLTNLREEPWWRCMETWFACPVQFETLYLQIIQVQNWQTFEPGMRCLLMVTGKISPVPWKTVNFVWKTAFDRNEM